MWWLYLTIGAFALLAGFLFGYAYRRNVAEAKIAKAEDAVKKLYDDAQRKAEEVKKEKILEAKEEVFRIRSDAERENRERRAEVQRNERRIFQREEILDKKSDTLEKRDRLSRAWKPSETTGGNQTLTFST
jgi:ribonuclease Y